ncbi:MAG TPA: hypothetical protein VFP22_04730, partial [Candidatus Limnocylindrales bacterium]|nr:hypothetical protein [Candidatus Limnocylindrales bacterium]
EAMGAGPKRVIPPLGADKRTCDHALSTLRDHRCPACGGTLRRCCTSVIGHEHTEFCQAVLDHLASKQPAPV